MKAFFTLLALLLLLISPAMAVDEPQEYTSGDYGYILLDDGTAEITQYFGTDAVVHLPDTIDGFTVTSLDFYKTRTIFKIFKTHFARL